MSTEFATFTRALERNAGVNQSIKQPPFNHITILGGGAEGRLLASLCLAQERAVTLFSAYGAELNELRAAGGITLRGAGPIGTFQIDLDTAPAIHTTAELDSAVAAADLIFLTGPVHKHRTYAMVLADHLHDGQTLVIAPARTFGALEISSLLTVGGCQADITIVEVQHLPYWFESSGSTLNLSTCPAAAGATLPVNRTDTLNALTALLPNLTPVANVLHSSFADGSGIVEAVGLMLAESAVAKLDLELLPGAEPLPIHNNFHSFFAASRSRTMLTAAFQERRMVASRLGVRQLPTDDDWIKICAGTENQIRFRPPNSEVATLLRSAVTGSLIPLQSAGRLVDLATPVTDALITVAGALLGGDVSASGRRLQTMGITAGNADEARRRLESYARGNG